jgi:hypothetical protein
VRLVPWLVAGAIVVSCTLPSADEFTSTPASVPDGGATVSDAGSDAPAPAPMDAGADAAVSALCPRTAVYCNDFESGEVADISDDFDVSDTAALTIEDGVLHAEVAGHADDGHFYALVGRTLSTTGATKATLEVDVNVEVVDWDRMDGNAIVLEISLEGEPRHAMELYVASDNASITTTTDHLVYDGADGDLPRGRTVRVRLESDFTPHDGSMRLYFDGKLVAHHDGIDFAPTADPILRFGIGLARNNAPTPPLDVKYDNLAVSMP